MTVLPAQCSEPELGAMALSDPDVLDEAERAGVPGDRGARVRDGDRRELALVGAAGQDGDPVTEKSEGSS